jgi:hypothetical protein
VFEIVSYHASFFAKNRATFMFDEVFSYVQYTPIRCTLEQVKSWGCDVTLLPFNLSK